MQESSKPRVMIAVPCFGSASIKFYGMLDALRSYNDGTDKVISYMADSMTYTARINLAQAALDANADYVLWIDSDMVFPANSLERLLAHDEDMVTGLYFMRRGNHAPVIYSEVTEDGRVVNYSKYPQNALIEVAGCGFGMVLMKTDVIRRVVQESSGYTFQPIPKLGEDLSFCLRFRNAGGRIWCDTTLKLGHMGEYVYTEDDWNG